MQGQTYADEIKLNICDSLLGGLCSARPPRLIRTCTGRGLQSSSREWLRPDRMSHKSLDLHSSSQTGETGEFLL